MARYENILQTIGNTPLVRLQRLAPDHVNLYVKLESFNPMGSVKDRMARAVIERAEQTGELRPGQTVIEATSGNTGIGLAMVCAWKGYPLVVVMAENFSVERRRLLRFLGAKVVLTPAAEKGTGMLAKAVELAEEHDWFLCRQFENEANADIHTQTTAREILADFTGEPLHYWVSGFGTGGTLKGVARGLKQADPSIKVIAVEPDNSPILSGGIPQPKDREGRIAGSHPLFRPHLMQGWSPDFISNLTEDAVADGLVDDVVTVDGRDALRLSQELARREGMLVGISSGATLAGALQVAREAPAGTNIVCMLPDTGERYLSTPLFEDIPIDMTEEEIAISRSTLSCRFDLPGAGAPRKVRISSDSDAEALTAEIIAAEPVVMFALEWCEFCWAVRKLFAALGVPYRSVDLDAVAYQRDNLGGRIRNAVSKRTGITTIPQIFVGGEFIGGCAELFDACREGSLQSHLSRLGVPYQRDISVDPQQLLPKWLQPRQASTLSR